MCEIYDSDIYEVFDFDKDSSYGTYRDIRGTVSIYKDDEIVTKFYFNQHQRELPLTPELPRRKQHNYSHYERKENREIKFRENLKF